MTGALYFLYKIFPAPLLKFMKIVFYLFQNYYHFTFRFISHLVCYSVRSQVQCQKVFSFFLFFFLSFFFVVVKKENSAPFRYIFVPKDESVTFVIIRSSYIHGSFCLFWPQSIFPALHQVRRRQWHPTPVLLPGKPHRQRSLVGYRSWGR